MSYAIVRVQKMKQGDLKGIQFHNQRERESETNKEIDKERSHLNYDLVNEKPIDYVKDINKMIKENVNKTVRKDAVRVAEFMVTSDKKFFDQLTPEQEKAYFEKSLEFFKEKYGEDKIAYAVVHKDEKTPHMHVGFVPITEDNRLSAKDFFGKKSQLHQLQDEFHQHVKENGFDLERGVTSNRKHIEMTKFKAMTQEKELEKIESKLVEIKSVEANIEKVEAIEGKQGFRDVVKLPKKDYELLKEIALDGVKAKYELHHSEQEKNALANEFGAFKDEVSSKQESLRKFVAESEKEVHEVKQENETIKSNLQNLAEEKAKNIRSTIDQATLQEQYNKGYEKGEYNFAEKVMPQMEKLKHENVDLKAENKEIKQSLRQLSIDKNSLTHDLNHYDRELKEERGKTRDLTNKYQSLKHNYDQAQQTIQKLSNQLHQLSKYMDKFKNKVMTKMSSWLHINLPTDLKMKLGDKFDTEKKGLIQSAEKSTENDLQRERQREKSYENEMDR